MQSLIQSGLISLAAMADSDENEAAAATSELVMLDAMYPGALSLDPPGWHEAERPELPVSGTLQCAELSGQPHLTVHFDLHYGYPLHTAFRVHVSCAEAGRDAGAILASWGAEQVEHLADSVAPLTEFVQALNEMPPLRNAPDTAVAEGSTTCSDVVAVAPANSGAVEFAAPLPRGHSGLVENRVDRQWLTFISFTTVKIAKAFRAAGEAQGLTGFLMIGKPGIACLEGGPRAIAAFLRVVRTDVFAEVDRASRKMNMSILEESCTRVRFEGFSVMEFPAPGPQRGPARADLLKLKEFLLTRGIVEKTFERVTMHLQHDV